MKLRFLKSLSNEEFDFVYTMDYDDITALFHGKKIETDTFPRDGLMFPKNVGFYFEHLSQLGLAGIFQERNQIPLLDPSGSRKQNWGEGAV
jgi:hypothetical protein